MNKFIVVLSLLLISSVALATPKGIYKSEVNAPLDDTYKAVYAALEEARFWVVFEADVGANMKRLSKRLGDKYNQNGLDGFKVMVVCNAFYANSVSNADPDLLALCPLRVSVTHKSGVTSVLFARPTLAAQGSEGLSVIQEIEESIINAIKAAVKNVK